VVRNPFGDSIAWVHGIKLWNDRMEGGADPGRDGMALSTDDF
jgi:gamma-glutamyltranspeptidase/glutathione hydrolase